MDWRAAVTSDSTHAHSAGEMDGRVRISLLGPIQVTGDSDAIELPGGHQRRLLSILAAGALHDRPITADEILEALYPGGQQPPRPRRALATEVWRLRQAIGAEVILTDDQGYRLDPRRCDLAAANFADLVAAGSAALRDGAPHEAYTTLTRALELMRGTPFGEVADYPAAQAAAARLEELRVGAVVDRADALARTGRYQDAIGEVGEITATRPTLERAWALLVHCHLRLGDPAMARRSFGTAQRVLAEDGLEVGPELAAVRQHLDGAPSAPTPFPIAARSSCAVTLVGRDEELGVITHRLAGALNHRQPSMVVIAGEAGIGKTALARGAAELMVNDRTGGPRVEWVRCDPRLTLPYGALTRFTAGMQLPDAGTARRSAELLRRTIVDRIETSAAEVPGMILIVDDAHWATPATLDVLSDLARSRSDVPLVIMATLRAVDNTAENAAELHRLIAGAASTLELRGLDEEATATLIGARADPDFVRRVHHLSGGNPLYIGAISTQQAHVDLATVPAVQLSSMIAARLQAVPTMAQDMLKVASVIGNRFDMRVLRAAARELAGPDGVNAVADGLRAAAGTNLVQLDRADGHEVDAPGGSFMHGLIRDHLYHEMPHEYRTRAHYAVARATQRLETDDGVPYDLLAHHFAHAWPRCPATTVAAHLQTAAEQAAAHLDFSTAHGYYQRAIDLLAMDSTDSDGTLTRSLLGFAGDAAIANGDLIRARHAFARLRRHAAGPALAAERLRADCGEILSYGAHSADSTAVGRLSEDLIEAVTGSEGAPLSAELMAESVAALYRHRPQQAERIVRAAAPTRPDAAAEARLAIWEQLGATDRQAAARSLIGDDSVDQSRAWLRMWVSDVGTAARAVDDQPAELTGVHPAAARGEYELNSWRITVAAATGRLRTAERLIEATLREVTQQRSAVAVAGMAANLHGQRMWLALLRGDTAAARTIANTVDSGWSLRHPITAAQEALRSALSGDIAAARDGCYQALDELGGAGHAAGSLLASLAIVGEVFMRTGDRSGATTCRDMLRLHMDEHIVFYFHQYFGPASIVIGQLSMAIGEFDTAVDDLRHGIVAAERAHASVARAQAHLHLSTALWHRNRGEDRRRAAVEHRLAHESGSRIGLWSVAAPPWPPSEPNPRPSAISRPSRRPPVPAPRNDPRPSVGTAVLT